MYISSFIRLFAWLLHLLWLWDPVSSLFKLFRISFQSYGSIWAWSEIFIFARASLLWCKFILWLSRSFILLRRGLSPGRSSILLFFRSLFMLSLFVTGRTSFRFGWSVFKIIHIELIATASDEDVGLTNSDVNFS